MRWNDEPTAEYQRTLRWLYALEAAKGMDFKLNRVARALERLGNPHQRFPSIHIGGTNGKGSVAAMLHAMLGAGGFRVGLYTSPHLMRFTERIRVGVDEIREHDVVALADELRRVTAGIELTFFELGTVMAFLHFARSNVDVAVVEVGLGGRLDATNVIDSLVSVITTIGLDHTEFLGDTIEAIAAEKAGIIKAGKPVILGRLPDAAVHVIRRIATERGSAVLELGQDFRARAADRGIEFNGPRLTLCGLQPSLQGSFQLDNMAAALAALTQLPASLAVDEPAIRKGLAAVRWPGRYEQIAGDPLIVLDGAHNIEGIRALVRELQTIAGGRPLHVLFAVMRDKSWAPMIELLAPYCASAVVTEVLPPRSAPAAEVAAVWARHCPVSVVHDPVAAWAQVCSCAKRGELVLVTGSLFLIGAVYPLCRGGWDVGDHREAGSGEP
jgi:dihydrofolate synthase/folylpolyglutamate synthase